MGKTTEKKSGDRLRKRARETEKERVRKTKRRERKKSGGKSEKIKSEIFNRKTTKIPNNSDALM